MVGMSRFWIEKKSTRLNTCFTREKSIWYLSTWFSIGTILLSPVVILSPLILILYSMNRLNFLESIDFFVNVPNYFYGSSTLLPTTQHAVSILLPGINLSIFGTLFWATSLLISTVFHEFGHFLAAKKYNLLI
jgi:hypothetical protein